ncbi:MAG: hypothetical protein HY973_04450 [Candidatus Kerfeldbacteria bacterium]|nr:hypothetical protein [Candidatus Kerfeldbacteria bacterium]
MSHPAIPNNHQPTGFILVVVSVITASLLLLANYLLSQSISETRISKSENAASKSYYLAEAGVNEAIFKLKNDNTWKTKFLAGTLNNDTASRSQVFDNYGNYTISATSVSPALADITVTANYQIGSKTAKRIIKTRFARATNPANTWSQSLFAGGSGGNENGNVTIERNCTANGGTIHANQTVKVKSNATLTVNDAMVNASNNIIINSGASLILNNSTQSEGVATIGIPIVDFDSSSPTSLKNRANQTYTENSFKNLPSGTTLNGITFVTGKAEWIKKTLTINGILAASDDIKIQLEAGQTLTVNSNTTTGSGIFGKDDITIELKNTSLTVNGLIYASKELKVEHDGTPTFSVTGGVIAWHLLIEGDDGGTCTITYNDELASRPLDPVYNGNESPIIKVNHWEEQY